MNKCRDSSNPLVSVVMPTKNVEQYIYASIKSVIDSTYSSLEIICVDDKSEDNTLQVIANFGDDRIRIVSNSGSGYTDGVNTGINKATGKYVINSDGDDLVHPTRIEKQVEFLESNPEYMAVCGDLEMLTTDGFRIQLPQISKNGFDVTSQILAKEVSVSHCSFMLNRNVIQDIPYRKWFVTASDIDFKFRLAEKTNIYYLPDTTFYYRLHSDSITHSQSNNQRIFFEEAATEYRNQRLENGIDDLDKGQPFEIPDPDNAPLLASNHVSEILLGQAWRLRKEGRYFEALNYGLRSFKYKKPGPSEIKSLIALTTKFW